MELLPQPSLGSRDPGMIFFLLQVHDRPSTMIASKDKLRQLNARACLPSCAESSACAWLYNGVAPPML